MTKFKALLVIFIMASFVSASATIFIVPGDYLTIQTAIYSVLNGDTVLAIPGTYYENVDFGAKSIVLGSLYLITGDTSYISSTAIDGNSLGPAVTIANGQDSSTILTGFTIRHGYNSDNGGGILLGASPKILHNRITLNVAANRGGGIYCSGGTPIIEYNEIIDNDAGSTFNKGGGAIYCYYSNARVSHNVIAENTGSIGGAIATYDCDPFISNNLIRNNVAFNQGGGIDLFSSGHWNYPTITYNVFIGNTATNRGGGIHMDEIDPTIHSNTFYQNRSNWRGGAFHCGYGSTPSVMNNIFWGDTASSGGNEIYVDASSPVITYCDIQDTVWTGEGNISCDPEFCDPDSGDLYLKGISCCAGNGQGGTDIGAYGVGCGPYPAPNIISVVPSQNALNVQPGSDISVTFDLDMDSTSINDSTFVVNGMSTGPHTGTITYDSLTRTATFDPAEDFVVGEMATVILTGDVKSSQNVPLIDYAWSFTSAADNGSGIFTPQVSYTVGYAPNSVFISDLDSDGDMDLSTANTGSGSVSILLNNGDGTFASSEEYYACISPISLFASDFDGDGDIDLAVADTGYPYICVPLNDGNGTFTSGMSFITGDISNSIYGSDFNGDGHIDLVTAHYWSNNISVLMNNGDSTFAAYVSYNVGYQPSSVVASDLDGDGDPDLAISNEGDDDVSVLMNNGGGTFASQITYSVGDAPSSVFASDLDGDSDLDLATTNSFSDNVSILLNAGDGTFSPHVTFAAGDFPSSIFASDFDGDGDLDLATSNSYSDSLSVILNNGDGTFASYQTFTAGDGPASIFSSDLDGDGDLDLAVANWISYDVSVLLNEDSGCDYVVGDVNGSDSYNGLDITYGVSFFKGGNPPQCDTCLLCPGWWYCGDVNASCNYNGLDITYGVSFFKGGSAPAPCADCPPTETIAVSAPISGIR